MSRRRPRPGQHRRGRRLSNVLSTTLVLVGAVAFLLVVWAAPRAAEAPQPAPAANLPTDIPANGPCPAGWVAYTDGARQACVRVTPLQPR